MTNSNSKSPKFLQVPLTVPFFAAMLIVCTIVRYFQYTAVIDPQSGFFEHDGGFLTHLYYILFVVVVAGLAVLSFIDAKSKRGILPKVSAGLTLSAVPAVIGAGLCAFCGFLLAGEAINAFGARLHIVQSAALTIAALGFTFIGYVVFTHRKARPISAIGFLFIAACYVCKASVLFMERIYTVNLSAQLIVLMVYLLLAVFFLSCGRLIVQSETRFTATVATVSGYTLVLLSFSESLSRIVYYFQSDSAVQRALVRGDNAFELPSVIFVAQGVAVAWFIYALTMKARPQSEHGDNIEIIEEIEGIDEFEEIEAEITEKPDNDSTSAD